LSCFSQQLAIFWLKLWLNDKENAAYKILVIARQAALCGHFSREEAREKLKAQFYFFLQRRGKNFDDYQRYQLRIAD